MPYLVVCPNCTGKFKSAQPVPAGRSLHCPTCQRPFTLSAPAPELNEPPPAARAPTPPKEPPPTARAPAPAPAPVAKPAPPRSAIPTGKLVPDLPAAIFVDDDEDDRPPVRGRRDDKDEDDDRPRARRGRDDDEDDRPRARRRDDVDEDDDRPPVRKRPSRAEPDRDPLDDDLRLPRPRKRKSNKALLIGLGAGGAALLLLLTCGGVLYFADPFGLFGGSSSDMLAWAPGDTQWVTYVDIEAAEQVAELRDEVRRDVNNPTQHGIKKEDVSAILVAGRTQHLGGEPDVTVIKLRAPADRNAVIAALGGTETTANGRKYYKTRTGGALFFPSDRMVVVSKYENVVAGRLGGDEGEVVVAEELRSAAKGADGLLWVAARGPAAEHGDFLNMMAGAGTMLNQFDKARFGGGGPILNAPPRARTTFRSVKVSGGMATVRFESTYDSSEAAGRVANDMRTAFNMLPAKEAGMEVDVSSSGATVTLRMSVPVSKGKKLLPYGL